MKWLSQSVGHLWSPSQSLCDMSFALIRDPELSEPVRGSERLAREKNLYQGDVRWSKTKRWVGVREWRFNLSHDPYPHRPLSLQIKHDRSDKRLRAYNVSSPCTAGYKGTLAVIGAGPPANYCPTRLKSPRGRKNVRPAALIMRQWTDSIRPWL